MHNSKIRELRARRGLTQSELASIIGVSRTCISSWECGERSPSFSNILSLCELFGEDPSVFSEHTTSGEASLLCDPSYLNAAGVSALCDFYNLLLSDEKYLKKP